MSNNLFKRPRTLYTESAFDQLCQMYYERGGECIVAYDGTLMGVGLAILHGDGLKTTIVREVALNCWSSAYTIRKYKKCPKKYQDMIERMERGECICYE